VASVGLYSARKLIRRNPLIEFCNYTRLTIREGLLLITGPIR